MKGLIYTLLVVGLLVMAFLAGTWYIKQQQHQEHRAELVLENIEKVWKLSTVEATISEIYKFKDYYYYDVSPLRKTALVKVNARVQAGFDFDSIQIEMNEDTRVIEFAGFPSAEILSVDHTLSYYDIQQGSFNSFSPTELTDIQARAKDSIQSAAIKSNILVEAEQSKADMIELITLAAKGMGWAATFNHEESQSLQLKD